MKIGIKELKMAASGKRWVGNWADVGRGGQEMGKLTGFAHLAPTSTRLGACLEITRDAATRDFGSDQGGEAGASPKRAVTTEPTQATDKRPAAQRVFVEKAVWLCCSSVEDPPRIFSFVAPRHSVFSTKTSSLVIFKQALRPDDSMQVVDLPHLAYVRQFWGRPEMVLATDETRIKHRWRKTLWKRRKPELGRLIKRENFQAFSRFFTLYHPQQGRNSAIFTLFRVGAFFEAGGQQDFPNGLLNIELAGHFCLAFARLSPDQTGGLATMRFLMLNWRDPKNPLSGGAERVTRAYLSALVKRGHEVFWFANAFAGCAREETIDGIQIVRGGGMGSSVVKAIQWYKTQKPFDLVMDQHHGIPWYAPWWCKTNCVAYIHEVLGPIWSAFYPWPISTLGRWQERWTHWFYREVPFWTASSCTRDTLQSHGVRSVKIIPYGVSTVALASLPDKPLDSPLRLAVVSRLAPNKRIDHAIRATRCLMDKGIQASLTIVGTGEVEGQLRQLTSDLQLNDRVVFTGPLSEADKDAQLQKAHFLLHTSMREGWGLNVIEANAMGTPGAVYPVAGLIESTLHDETGLISELETPESLAAALASILPSPEKYQRYRVQAWNRAKTLHWDNVLPGACDWLEQQGGKTVGREIAGRARA